MKKEQTKKGGTQIIILPILLVGTTGTSIAASPEHISNLPVLILNPCTKVPISYATYGNMFVSQAS